MASIDAFVSLVEWLGFEFVTKVRGFGCFTSLIVLTLCAPSLQDDTNSHFVELEFVRKKKGGGAAGRSQLAAGAAGGAFAGSGSSNIVLPPNMNASDILQPCLYKRR